MGAITLLQIDTEYILLQLLCLNRGKYCDFVFIVILLLLLYNLLCFVACVVANFIICR